MIFFSSFFFAIISLKLSCQRSISQMFFKRFRAKFLACATLQNFVQFNMAAVEDRNRSLKQALVESLSAFLSPDQQSRQTAEEQLKVLEVTEGKNVCFCSYFGPIAAQFSLICR